MSKIGDTRFNYPTYENGTAFGFIDLDNVARGLIRAAKSRCFTQSETEILDLPLLFLNSRLIRYYLYSAISPGAPVPDRIAELRKLPRFVFRDSILTNAGTSPKQEGVDVRLALEAIQCAHKGTMSHCTIFSCDGDLLPLVNALVSEGIFTTVACFNDPELGDVASRLRDAADEYVHLGDHILTQCFTATHKVNSQGSGPAEGLINRGRLEEISVGDAMWEIVVMPDGSSTLMRDRRPTSETNHWRFPTELGARAWLKLNFEIHSGRARLSR